MKPLSLIFFLLLSALLVWLSAGIGFGGWQAPHTLEPVMLEIRLPRVAAALLVGAALSAAGAGLQALFENPLADPGLIGTSAGAALGVVGVLALGWTGVSVPLAAFAGALAVCLLILAAHRFTGGGTSGLLILGLIVSAFCSATVSLILFLSDDLTLRSASIWLAGSLAEAGFVPPGRVALVMLAGLALLLSCGRGLDCLMLGEDTAHSSGIAVGRLRVQTVIAAALLTGAAVSLSGIIGFIGMMVPNILASAVGGGRQRLIVLSAWLGGIMLLVLDSAARWIAFPVDLPVGIVIALLGGPFFMWLFLHSIHRKAG